MPTRRRRAPVMWSVPLGVLIISGWVICCGGPISRPGGAPPGAELVELPGGAESPLETWLSHMHSACKAANPNYGPHCLNLHINYTPKNGPHKNCRVHTQDPVKGTKVTTSTLVTLVVTCGPSTGTGTAKSHHSP